MALTHVLTPLKIGAVEIKNRVVRPAHGTLLGAGTMTEDLVAYHEARAKGGVGLSIVEIMGVHPSSLGSLNIADPSLSETYPRFLDRIRPHGMKMFQQLWHGGHNVFWPSMDGSPPWSASDIPSVVSGIVPTPMTKSMIDEVIESFAQAARKLERWGIDGIDLHCAHGYLPAQFLSPIANNREDEYGGSLENRARFIKELVSAVRSAVSSKTAVGLRIAPETTAGGVSVEDCIYVMKMLEDLKVIDYANISFGNYHAFSKMVSGMFAPPGFELPTSLPIARAVKVPSLVVGRFRTLEEADQIIRAGDADMVGFVRATIADPDLVRKTMEGHPEQVRPCLGCNQECFGGIFNPISPRLRCTVNPAVGFESKMGDDKLQRVDARKHIVVVGGGPAGMEAARVAAIRGHRVTVMEAQPRLGGAVNFAAMAPTRAGIRDSVVWQEEELDRLGVDVRLNAYAELDDILGEKPDAVILAAGSVPRMDGVQVSNPREPMRGMQHRSVISSLDLFQDVRRELGRKAVVIDDVGHYEGLACAEYLVAKGLDVVFVTRHASPGIFMETSFMVEPALERMGTRLSVRVRSRGVEVSDAGVRIGPTYYGVDEAKEVVPADTVVFVSQGRPNNDLRQPLMDAGVSVSVVGDAQSPRFMPAAVREGYLAGASV
jgi:2,4-dienoyl-CoA reductase-like NADH-dependent reductase (Old Yellow Enzyme family)